MSCRAQLHQAIDKLTDKQVESVKHNVDMLLEQANNDDLHELLRIPGIRLGRAMDPDRMRFEPIKVDGELVSEQLIRER